MEKDEKESSAEKLHNSFAKLKEKYNLPEFKLLEEDFDMDKLEEKEGDIKIKDIRRLIAEKTSAYLRFFEALINPSSSPSFVFSFLKNPTESETKEIKDCYKEFSRIQIQTIKLDTIYNEKEEIKFINETVEKWQTLKKRVFTLVENFEQKFEKNSLEKEKSYFG